MKRFRRPPEPRIAGGRYARWMTATLTAWGARVRTLAADGLTREELEAAWAHLTNREHVAPMLARLALDIEQELARYYRAMFRRPQPTPPAPGQARAEWVDEQFRLLADVGADQIDRLLKAQAELARGARTDAKPAVTRATNAARKANAALIGGTDLRQHTQLVELFKTAQASGSRHETLPGAIQEIMGIGERRAKLIARDQTVKHNAAANQAQAKAAGIVEYVWRCTRDDSLRPMHRELDGKTFRYDDPPVTNKDGDRNHPGEDYQCRCQAEPKLTEEQDLFAGLDTPAFEGLGFGAPAAPAPRARAPRAERAAPKPRAKPVPPAAARTLAKLEAGVPEEELSFLRNGYRPPLTNIYEGVPADLVDEIATGLRAPAESSKPLPPIKLAGYPDGTIVLADGRHRLEAAQQAGATRIRARVLQYDDELGAIYETETTIPVPRPDAAKLAQLKTRFGGRKP